MRPPTPRPQSVTIAGVVVGLGLGATIALSVTTETWSQFKGSGGALSFFGNATALVGTYLALVMLLLISRLSVVERVLGQDGMLRWHRKLAPWPIGLLVAHVVLVTIGFAQYTKSSVMSEVNSLITSYPGVLLATVGFAIMMVVAISSVYQIRRRLPREYWWLLHLAMYVGLGLSYIHVVDAGQAFIGHPLASDLWLVGWILVGLCVATWRLGVPLARSLRHQLVVSEVRSEGPGVVSVVLKGRHVERLAIDGGQFFEWRFMARGMWWQAHPFSISARPKSPYLRLTVKVVGDFTQRVADLAPGTRVFVEGPYGTFTSHRRAHIKTVLIAGGIGVTAVRSLLEDLPSDSEPIVILRARDAADLVLVSEVTELVRRRKGQVHELLGARGQVNFAHLSELVPDIRLRDVYVAGGETFVDHVVTTLHHLGLSPRSIHFEVYAL